MEDLEIVQLYWDRNQEAIRVTSEKYGKYCYKIAVNILGDHEDSEECVNDTWLNAWNAMPPHRPSILSTFLGKLTRNLSFNRYKYNKAKKRKGNEFSVILDELGECIASPTDVEDELEKKELVSDINAFLSELSDLHRRIFLCRFWYADSVSDIAEQLHITENNVSVILNRTKKKLKKHLEERGYN